MAIFTWVMKPCCSPVKISPGSWPFSIRIRVSGAARKLKTGPATMKVSTMQTTKASTE